METLKYKVITSEKQYNSYAKKLEALVFSATKTREMKDEIALLTLLIETYDKEHNTFDELNPIELLLSLMHDHGIKARDLAQILGVSKGYVSDILHYKKGLSKEVIRTLATYFKVSQEAFNRPYEMAGTEPLSLKSNARKLPARK